MGIFGQIPQGQANDALCESRAVVERKGKFTGCPETPPVDKDCRGHLLIGCDLRVFRISECGDFLFVSCEGIAPQGPAVWVCEDCCPSSWAPVKAVFGESFTVPTGYFAKLADGRILKWDPANPETATEIACEPTTHQECITCVTASGGEGEAVIVHPHKPKVRPSDYSLDVAVTC